MHMGFDSNRRKRLLPVPRVKVEGGREGGREAKAETENRIRRSTNCKKTQRLAPPTYFKLASRQTCHKVMVDMNENRIHTGFWLKRRC